MSLVRFRKVGEGQYYMEPYHPTEEEIKHLQEHPERDVFVTFDYFSRYPERVHELDTLSEEEFAEKMREHSKKMDEEYEQFREKVYNKNQKTSFWRKLFSH